MDNDQERVLSFTRRALILGGINGALMMTLAGRLAWLQLAQGDKFRTLAENNRIQVKLIAPVRGLIYDRSGQGLAINEQDFRVQIVPEQADDIEASLETLSRILPLRPNEIDAVLSRARQQPRFLPIEIIDNLSWEQVAAIEVNMPDLPGISIDVGQRRFYPQGPATAHVVGYVGAVARSDQTGDPVLGLPGFRVGKTGLEKAFEDELRGGAGTSRIEVNVAGRTVRELEREDGTPGEDLSLTIDLGLQQKMQEYLAREKSASAVVMDAHTGAVYALASSPSFDPNLFSTGIPQSLWTQLTGDDTHPLNDKAVGGVYPPGSTFKMVSAMAGLEANVIKPGTRVFCPGYYDLGDHRFHCWKHNGHGTVNLTDALAQSCDVFFYSVSRDIGIDRIAAMARRLGLGEALGIELPEERAGTVPTQAWKEKTFGKKWDGGETVVASIGQGYLLATPLQLATMVSRLVNGGVAVRPWLVAQEGGRATPNTVRTWPQIGLNTKALAQVKAGMDAVVNDDKGTAHPFAIKDESRTMGGKTGTAQVRRITMQQRNEGVPAQEDQPWKYRHHGLFVGYAPADAPRYVTCVVVEHGGASGAAVPIARDILLAAQDIDPAAKPVQAPKQAPKTSTGKEGA
ncbi:MAG: penicillin-binding protein 2 [Rhodospirillales bacterium]|nr:penicillin-binding protein 2 [Alphaproteobacteria bacterium]MCB9987014.1 penicillin-binding protein 2 [Rhodospirillales bacterium]USO08213.1 MAG: penicillin-binding protein 2 [Rhodospirillales bacterium]